MRCPTCGAEVTGASSVRMDPIQYRLHPCGCTFYEDKTEGEVGCVWPIVFFLVICVLMVIIQVGRYVIS